MLTRNWIISLLILASLSACSSTEKKEEATATAEELYAAAKESMEKGNWLTSVDQLRALEAQYPYGVYAEQAKIDTIYSYYRNGDADQAIAAADRFIKLHPTHEHIDYPYYLKGLAHYKENPSWFGRLTGRDDLSDRDANITRNALDAFTDVYTLFPHSRYANDSRARTRHLHDALARHEIAVAAYYYSRSAYVAVVSRAKHIMEDYSNTPSAEDALALLVYSYQQMGLNELSDSSRRVLVLNFPQSPYLNENGGDLFEKKLKEFGIVSEKETNEKIFSLLWTRPNVLPTQEQHDSPAQEQQRHKSGERK